MKGEGLILIIIGFLGGLAIGKLLANQQQQASSLQLVQNRVDNLNYRVVLVESDVQSLQKETLQGLREVREKVAAIRSSLSSPTMSLPFSNNGL